MGKAQCGLFWNFDPVLEDSVQLENGKEGVRKYTCLIESQQGIWLDEDRVELRAAIAA